MTLTKSFKPSTSFAFLCAVPSLLGGFSLVTTDAEDCLLLGLPSTLLPPLFSLSELPLTFVAGNLPETPLGGAFGVPLRVEVADEATEGGRLIEAEEPGRRVTVEGLLLSLCCAGVRPEPGAGGEGGIGGGMLPVGEA